MNQSVSQQADIMTAETGTIALLARAEVDMQIATAQRYPRSISKFIQETLSMVTLNERIAADCIYALPRDGKTVEGPSARFAEVIASAWGNCRAGARVVNEGPEFITAQGVFHDLQRNVAITYEIQRRITTSGGKRYGADMIGVTGNAASSIALRQAILKGIPKAFWSDMYDAARKMAKGDVKTLANRRADALKFLSGYGIKPAQVFALLDIQGEPDITLDHLLTLRGISTAIKEGDTTPEQAFPAMQPPKAPPAAPKPAEAQPAQGQADAAPQTDRRPPSPPKPPSAPPIIDNDSPAGNADWTAELTAYSDQLASVEDDDALTEAIEMFGARFADAPDDVRAEATKTEGAERARIARAAS